MDDIRRPQHLKRRDYTAPSGRPAAPSPPHHPPNHPSPHHQPHTPQQSPHHFSNHNAQPAAPAPIYPAHEPLVHPHQDQSPQAVAAPAPAQSRSRNKISKKLTIVIAILLAAAAIFGAGYLLKGSNDSNGIPASITRQVNYDLYFPSPMPPGYIYMKDTATFQIGQVFYKFANGKKRVTVNEQPMPETKPNLNLLAGYTQFQSAVGKAAIGTSVGEPTAVVLTPTTIITMHCIGGVSQDDLKTAIGNLKNIGQKT
jgi:hypothetical protein